MFALPLGRSEAGATGVDGACGDGVYADVNAGVSDDDSGGEAPREPARRTSVAFFSIFAAMNGSNIRCLRK